ncbi:MAG: sigma-54-dependent Fis family transcriptional regulator [Deltaproteobacteria bacterium]|nr:sigma-54-dependent Fis family transcriptional regulator [Deltaproteobacteria bacterium]
MSDPRHTVLIVDDDLNVLEVIDARLSSNGFHVLKASGAEKAIKILKNEHIDLMISDMKMPGMGGLDLFSEVRGFRPDLPVIFLTAYGSIPDAVSAVKAGAVDYVAKPFDGHELLRKLREILKNTEPGQKLSEDNKASSKNMLDTEQSPAMQELMKLIERVSVSSVSVLILGESGSGKEHAARLIHQSSPRRDRPFIVVDCGSTPPGILESELFGHVKGAFTHAIRNKNGLISEADGGTLFLDEIGNISPDMQIRLLRFIEDRKIRRIGDINEISVDCRVIAATNSDLIEDMRAGRFREDLYYRLRVVTLKIPHLRERKQDVKYLARYFVKSFCNNNDIPMVELPSETIKWLSNYPWPGNVRELKNALEAGIVLCDNGVLRPEDLQLTGLPDIAPDLSNDNILEKQEAFSLEESERSTIVRALKETKGVQKDAADLLGISRRAIHYKIKKYAIDISEIRAGR